MPYAKCNSRYGTRVVETRVEFGCLTKSTREKIKRDREGGTERISADLQVLAKQEEEEEEVEAKEEAEEV